MSKESIFTKKIEIPHEKEIIRVAVVMYLYYWLLYLYDLTIKIPTLFATELANAGIKILITAPFVFVYIKWCKREPKINLSNKKQYKIIPLLLVICAIDYVVESFIYYGGVEVKFALIRDGRFGWIIFYFIEYFFVVAVAEEFLFRILIQNDLIAVFGKASILAPLLSAAYFGFVHTVQRSTEVAISAFVYGLIVGYAKYFNKNCTFVTLVVVHGLYDFLSILL